MKERLLAYRNYILTMLKNREEEEKDDTTGQNSGIEELERDCE